MIRRLVVIVGASALYAALALLNSIPDIDWIRPGIAVPLIAGALFGPVAGLAVGLLGSAGSDLVEGGFSWNWTVASGAMGAIAGVANLMARRFPRAWTTIAGGVALGALAVVIGAVIFAVSDVAVANLDIDDALGAEGVPIATWGLEWGLPLLAAGLIASLLLTRRSRPAPR